MNIYIYSDESGVFDKEHNDIYVFGGLIILGNSEKEKWSRMYSHAEKVIRDNREYDKDIELKASFLSNGDKYSLFRSLNNCHKFGGIVRENKVLDNIYKSKKDKQRYLDYVYKLSVKNAFQNLIAQNLFDPSDVDDLCFYVDEHTTATNGQYELREGLEQEFKYGTYNWQYSKFFPPIFPSLKDVKMNFCNSQKVILVRSADIVANKIFYLAQEEKTAELLNISNLSLKYFP